MIHIKGGNFTMGSEGFGEFESPVHAITISDFLLDETLVTNKEFNDFVSATNYESTAEKNGAAWGYENGAYKIISGLNWKSYYTKERADHPVVLVSWHDAIAYCKWANKRLPTEAEWEYAAKSGEVENLYPWGNTEPDGTQSVFAQKPGSFPGTDSVKNHQPNVFGLYDMVGNAWQWCNDWFGETYYSLSEEFNPQGPAEGQTKVRRGGAWNVIQSFRLRGTNRGAMLPDAASPNVGFRCAKSIV